MLFLDKTQFKQYLSTKGTVEKFLERKLQTTEINHIQGIIYPRVAKLKEGKQGHGHVRACARAHTHACTLTLSHILLPSKAK